MKKRLLAVLLSITALILTGCGSEYEVAETIGTKNMKISAFYLEPPVNSKDIYQVTTYASYVFVAEVVSYDKTVYEDGDGEKPVTYYTIRVIDNIKGSLIRNKEIPLTKAGGLRKGTKHTYLISDGDTLPKVGSMYVFAAVVKNGELYCSMANTVAEINSTIAEFRENAVYQRYVASCENVIEGIPNGADGELSKYDSSAR